MLALRIFLFFLFLLGAIGGIAWAIWYFFGGRLKYQQAKAEKYHDDQMLEADKKIDEMYKEDVKKDDCAMRINPHPIRKKRKK